MYEHAMRLGQEVSGLDSLQKQVSVNLLLSNKEFAKHENLTQQEM